MNKLKTNQAVFLKRMLDTKEKPFSVSQQLATKVRIYQLKRDGLVRDYCVKPLIGGVRVSKPMWRIKDMDRVIEIVRESLKERVA